MSVEIEHGAPASVSATTAQRALTIEHTAPATVTLEETTGDLTITRSAPATVTIETASTTVAIVAQAPAVVTIDAESTPPLSLGEHDVLDSLAHEIAETSETELAYDGDGQLVRATVWASSARARKVREKLLTYAAGVLTQSVTTQHDASGTVIVTLTKTFTYDGDGDLVTVVTTRS